MNSRLSLSNGEWKIMKLLWKNKTMTVGEFVAALEKDTGWNKNTVFTMLKRLEEKGAVKMLTKQRPQKYVALIARGDAENYEASSFISRVFDGSVGLFVSALTDRNKLSKREIEELRGILDKAESELEQTEE